MSRWGTHPQPERTREAAWQVLPRGCTTCRYMWRCGFDPHPCRVCEAEKYRLAGEEARKLLRRK